MAANRIGPMMNDMNVDTTFEGDNTVMMQQARQLAGSNGALQGRQRGAKGALQENGGGTAARVQLAALVHGASRTAAAVSWSIPDP